MWQVIPALVGAAMAAKGGGGGTQTQTTSTRPWNDEDIQGLISDARFRYQEGPNEYYPGSTVAEMTPEMQNIIGQMTNFGQQPMTQAGGNALMQALGGVQGLGQQVGQEQVQGTGDYASFLMNQGMAGGGGNVGDIASQANPTQAYQQFLNPQQNPYVDQLVQQVQGDISQNLNENIMPRIDQQSMMNNAYGGSRQGIAQGKAIQGAQEQASNAASQIRSSAYESGQNRKLNAANQMLGAAGQSDQYNLASQQQGLSGANLGRGLFNDLAGIQQQQAGMAPLLQAYQGQNMNMGLQGAQMNQNYLQALLSEDVNRWNFEQNADDQNFQNYANLLLGAAGKGQTATSTQNIPGASMGERLLGGLSTGVGLYGAMGGSWGGGG